MTPEKTIATFNFRTVLDANQALIDERLRKAREEEGEHPPLPAKYTETRIQIPDMTSQEFWTYWALTMVEPEKQGAFLRSDLAKYDVLPKKPSSWGCVRRFNLPAHWR